jgi:hypothetical protein
VGYSGCTEYDLRAAFSILSLIRVWSHTVFSVPTFFLIFLHFSFSVQNAVKLKIVILQIWNQNMSPACYIHIR